MQRLLSKRRALTSFSTYFLTSVINRALPFVLLPILTRYLAPDEYGQWSIFQVLVSFSTPVICMNMQNNITRNFYKKNQEEVGRITSNVLLILGANLTISLILIGLLTLLFESFQGIPTKWLLTIPIFAATDLLFQINITILRNQGKAALYGAFQIASTFLNLFFTIILVVLYHLNWEGRVAGWLFETVALGVISLWVIYKLGYLVFDANRSRLREILKVSLPLVPHALSGVVMSVSDRLFINHLVDASAVGVYSVGYQFGMMILLITDAFNLVWTPWMYRQLANMSEARKLTVVKLTYLYNVGVVIFALGVALASPILIRLFTTTAYDGANQYVLWIAMGYAFRAMYAMVFSYFIHEGKTNFLAAISLIGAITNLIGNYFLITRNGAIGGAQATLVSYIFMYLATWWYSNRIYPMPWLLGWGRIQRQKRQS